MYIKDRSYFEKQVVTSKVLNELGVNKEQFIENVQIFNEYVKTNFNSIQQHMELAMEVEIGNHLAKGEADLVLNTAKGLILIDYKTYAGNDDIINLNSKYYAGKYSGQLSIYSQMLEKIFGKKVIRKLIYYVVRGNIVEIQ